MTHTHNLTIKCQYCDRYFKNKRSRANHIKWHDLPQYKEFQQNSNCKRKGENHPSWKGDGIVSRLIENNKTRDFSGINNPMFGKHSWNAGLTTDTDVRMKLLIEKREKNKNG